MLISHRKEIRKLTFRALVLRRSERHTEVNLVPRVLSLPWESTLVEVGQHCPWRWESRCCYILKVKRVVSEILPDQCFSPFFQNVYEYEMLIERKVCLFSLLFQITVNSLLQISVISFSQHKNYVTVKFAMGCIQLNEKLVARLKIGQFWNESSWILRTHGRFCCCQVLPKIFHCKRIEWPSNLRVDEFNEIQSWSLGQTLDVSNSRQIH